MPAAWIGLGTALMGAFGGSGGGSTGGAGPNMYVPTGLSGADQGWQYNQGALQSMLNQGWPQGAYSPWTGGQSGIWQNQPGAMMGQQPSESFGGTPSRATAQQAPNPYSNDLGNPEVGSPFYNGGGMPAYYASQGQGQGQPQQQQQAPQYGGGGLASITNPLLMQSLMQGMGINYNPFLQASQQAGQQYGNLANTAGQAGNVMAQQAGANFGQQQNLQNAGNSLWNQAADPQQALYQRMLQQNQDQSAATNSMYGLGQSGLGAGIAGQNLNNFNIDWQNNQLSRMLQGAEGMGSLSRTGGQMGTLGAADLQAGMGYYGMQPGYTQQSASVPLQAQQQVAGMPQQLAGQYTQGISQAMTPYLQQQNQQIPYLFQGAGAGANAFSNTLDQNKFQNQQMGQAGQALGGVNWGAIGQAFSPASGYGSITGGYVDTYGNTYNNPSAYTAGP